MHATLVEVIFENLRIFHKENFLNLYFSSSNSETYSYSQIIYQAQGWCVRFRECGAKAGDVIAVMLPHSEPLYSCFLGAIWAGCIPTMFPVKSQKFTNYYLHEVLKGLFTNSSAYILVTDNYMKSELDIDKYALKFNFHLLIIEKEEIISVSNIKPAIGSPEDIAFLQFSSGTTGAKKGVTVTHQALLKQVSVYADAINLKQQDCIVSWLPLYHDMGLITSFLLPFICLVPIVAISAFDWIKKPAVLMQIISNYNNVICWLPNFAYQVLSGSSVDELELEHVNLAGVKVLINCSEPVSEEVHTNLIMRYKKYGLKSGVLSTCYALAENVFAVTSSVGVKRLVDCVDGNSLKTSDIARPYLGLEMQKKKHVVSSGILLADTKVKICINNKELCDERVVGEILISSGSLFVGYYKNTYLTSKSFVNGWYKTGDFGYIYKDHLFVLGRLDDVLVIRGENFYSQDIEQCVNKIAGVILGRVVAFTVENVIRGSSVLIVVAECKNKDKEFRINLAQKIISDVKKHLSVDVYDAHVVDNRWLFKSTSGKISRSRNRDKYLKYRRYRLEEYYNACSKYYPNDMKRQSICKSIIKLLDNGFIQYLTNTTQIIEENLILEGVVDSLGMISLVVAFEREFDVCLESDSDLALKNFCSIASMVELIVKKSTFSNSKIDYIYNIHSFSRNGSVRDDKSSYYIRSHKSHDLLILGSSTSWPLSTKTAKEMGFSAFNFSVESAMSEDWYCILRFILDNSEKKPKLVILGIDIESFSNYRGADLRLLKSQFLNSYLKAEDKNISQSLEIKTDSMLNRRDQLLKKFRTIDSEKEDGYDYGFDEKNGNFVFLNGNKKNEKFNRRIAVEIEDPTDREQMYLLRFKNYTHLDKKRLAYFKKFLKLCYQNKVYVQLFFPPIHKKLRNFLSQKTKYLSRKKEIEEVIFQLIKSSKCNINFEDFSDTNFFNGNESDFRNSAHTGAYNCDLILNRLLQNKDELVKP